ncbi:unnamed protein product [Protopolystoma xenopodis]|uniref:Uncharacterized protein n=1 Tax=Protopolystoma xenopodis TaxID=117903 RepID=A0A3S5CV45_9PLAT|nr:unnamed protein product [Protopolystoma xenopodis]
MPRLDLNPLTAQSLQRTPNSGLCNLTADIYTFVDHPHLDAKLSQPSDTNKKPTSTYHKVFSGKKYRPNEFFQEPIAPESEVYIGMLLAALYFDATSRFQIRVLHFRPSRTKISPCPY